ncbi:MAG: nucleotidyltransferase family protein [Bacteroidota bacterium]
MKAMFFSAGLGTRLRPLTNDRPKALVEVSGRPLLEWNILRLKAAGYTDIVVNVHHFGQRVMDFVQGLDLEGMRFYVSDERSELLDTGGGLWHARQFLADGEDFLLCNADILTDLDLAALRQQHLSQDGLATLSVRQRQTSRYLLFDENKTLCGWQNVKTGETKMSREETDLIPWAFSGHHYISPRIFPLIAERGVFSIIDLYLRLAKQHDIYAFPDQEASWLDVGKPERLALAADLLTKMAWSHQMQESEED